MSNQEIRIEVQPLKLKLKSTIRHAGATRKEGESIWVKAERNGTSGFGEGCPREYVAGDDLEQSVLWARENFTVGKEHFSTFEDVEKWISKNGKIIDKYPSAWCAVETALLVGTREHAGPASHTPLVINNNNAVFSFETCACWADIYTRRISAMVAQNRVYQLSDSGVFPNLPNDNPVPEV